MIKRSSDGQTSFIRFLSLSLAPSTIFSCLSFTVVDLMGAAPCVLWHWLMALTSLSFVSPTDIQSCGSYGSYGSTFVVQEKSPPRSLLSIHAAAAATAGYGKSDQARKHKRGRSRKYKIKGRPQIFINTYYIDTYVDVCIHFSFFFFLLSFPRLSDSLI